MTLAAYQRGLEVGWLNQPFQPEAGRWAVRHVKDDGSQSLVRIIEEGGSYRAPGVDVLLDLQKHDLRNKTTRDEFFKHARNQTKYAEEQKAKVKAETREQLVETIGRRSRDNGVRDVLDPLRVGF